MKEKQLYREQYRNFEQYCQARWGFGRRYADYLIGAEETKQILGTVVPDDSIDLPERQTRPLTQLPPDQQREAWEEAVRTAPNGKITGAHVERVVKASQPVTVTIFSSETNEYYTPPRYLEAARQVICYRFL